MKTKSTSTSNEDLTCNPLWELWYRRPLKPAAPSNFWTLINFDYYVKAVRWQERIGMEVLKFANQKIFQILIPTIIFVSLQKLAHNSENER